VTGALLLAVWRNLINRVETQIKLEALLKQTTPGKQKFSPYNGAKRQQ
jgi:hypothetical protein